MAQRNTSLWVIDAEKTAETSRLPRRRSAGRPLRRRRRRGGDGKETKTL